MDHAAVAVDRFRQARQVLSRVKLCLPGKADAASPQARNRFQIFRLETEFQSQIAFRLQVFLLIALLAQRSVQIAGNADELAVDLLAAGNLLDRGNRRLSSL